MKAAVSGLRNYLVITAGYWGFTVTDGAIRMLVVLYFHQIGYSPLQIAMLFLFYEFFGVVTNLAGGWLAARIGLNRTMHIGMLMQVLALLMLTVPDLWLSVSYVMLAQALSGIAKDLNKMSAKASVKLMLPSGQAQSENRLFKYVALLTGSKNSLKGAGFFLGGLLLSLVGFRGALLILAGALFILLVITYVLLPEDIGRSKHKAKFSQLFSRTPEINWLSAARFFLFGSRDVWFVVALPVFLGTTLGWQHAEVGAFLALWVIGYGLIQAAAPGLLGFYRSGSAPGGTSARFWVYTLALFPAAIAIALRMGLNPTLVLISGLAAFGAVFAINSALHSYLILAYSDHDKVAMDVGFYYMANAGGRLLGTILSGWSYQQWGITGCLWLSTSFVLCAAALSMMLTDPRSDTSNAQLN